MPSDAFTYNIIADELNAALQGGYIQKIAMPQRCVVLLTVKNEKKAYSLIMSADASAPMCRLTNKSFESPDSAPSFLMHLRKHIGGGKILSVSVVPFERVVKIDILAKNELGVASEKTLVAEIMGKHSNIILVSGGVVSDSIKRITADISGKRQVLPGFAYENPPAQEGKFAPTDTENVKTAAASFEGGRLDNYMQRHIFGLAPATVSEAVFGEFGKTSFSPEEAGETDFPQRTANAFASIYTRKAAPVVTKIDGKPKDFFAFPYASVSGENIPFDSVNEAMEYFFGSADEFNRTNEKSRAITGAVRQAITKCEKRLSQMLERLSIAQDYDDDRIKGELITANIYAVRRGENSVKLFNYYDNTEVEIALDGRKSPQENAQSYFKKYSKSKKATAVISQQIEDTKSELEYLSSVEAMLITAQSLAEIAEIRLELENAGVVKKQQGRRKNAPPAPSKPLSFSEGKATIYVGKNNLQNDRLTKSGKPDDLWLHTKDIHGSHVLVTGCNGSFPDELIYRAASLAAYYSKARFSDNVPVDYTLLKYVQKPKGAPPGRVIYTHQKTVYVKPAEIDG